MKPHLHTAASVAFSGLLYFFFKSWALAISSLVSGVLIDLDYLADFIRQRGLTLNRKSFREFYLEEDVIRMRILHGWEWPAVLLLAAWLSGWNAWFTGLMLGFGQHILLDKLYMGEGFLCYSLAWRWSKGFKQDEIFKKSYKRR